MNTILKFARKGEPDIPSRFNGLEDNLAQRTQFPAMTLDNYLETRHFEGGSTCNYVSLVTLLDVHRVKHWAANLVFKRLEDGAIGDCVLVWSFLLEGNFWRNCRNVVGFILYIYTYLGGLAYFIYIFIHICMYVYVYVYL